MLPLGELPLDRRPADRFAVELDDRAYGARVDREHGRTDLEGVDLRLHRGGEPPHRVAGLAEATHLASLLHGGDHLALRGVDEIETDRVVAFDELDPCDDDILGALLLSERADALRIDARRRGLELCHLRVEPLQTLAQLLGQLLVLPRLEPALGAQRERRQPSGARPRAATIARGRSALKPASVYQNRHFPCFWGAGGRRRATTRMS